MIYFTSDQHFGHRNIIKYANRPFTLDEQGVKDCTETIINNYNKLVQDEDTVYHLGDLTMAHENTRAYTEYIIKHLKGKKILIRGNHDDESDQFYLDCGFDEVHEYLILGDKFLCHYPCYKSKWTTKEEKIFIEVFQNSGCTTIYHGHVHNKNPDEWEPDGIKRVNVCVDYTPNKFNPVKL